MSDTTESLRTVLTPRSELAAKAKEHYLELSDKACHFNSVVPKAIDAWEREPTLLARLEAAEQLRSLLSKALFVVEEHRHEAMLASDIRNALRDTVTLAREETDHE